LHPNIGDVTTEVASSKQPGRDAATFDSLKILRIDYYDDDSSFPGDLVRFVPHLQEMEINGCSIAPFEILTRWPRLTKLFVRSYYMDGLKAFRSGRNFSSLQRLALLILAQYEAEFFISRCQSLRKLELITHWDFYVWSLNTLTQLQYLEEVSLGALRGLVPPEAATLLSKRCSTTILLEDPQSASLYQHCPGVRVDTDRWLEMTKPGLSEIIVHNSSGTCYRKLFSHKTGTARRLDRWEAFGAA
jgi:hypothetical protein